MLTNGSVGLWENSKGIMFYSILIFIIILMENVVSMVLATSGPMPGTKLEIDPNNQQDTFHSVKFTAFDNDGLEAIVPCQFTISVACKYTYYNQFYLLTNIVIGFFYLFAYFYVYIQ